MLELMALIAYVIVVIAVGIKLYSKANPWIAKVEGVLPFVERGEVIKYALVAFLLASLVELGTLYALRNSTALLALAFPLSVGLIEEGAKLIPYFSGGETLRRWHLTIRVAFTFAVIEAVLYGVALLARGNVFGALLRVVVVIFHVAFTAVALEDALRGSLIRGYLKASLIHALYDAPVFSLVLGKGAVVLVVTASIIALLYTYGELDEAFGLAYSLGKRKLEERKAITEEFRGEGEWPSSNSVDGGGEP